MTPRSRGGANAQYNLVACCWPCNQLKGDMTKDEFIAYLATLDRIELPNRPKNEEHDG